MSNFTPKPVVGTRVHAKGQPARTGTITAPSFRGLDRVVVTWDDGTTEDTLPYMLKDIEAKRLAGERAAARWATP